MNIKSILLTSTAIIAFSSATFASDKESYQATTKIEKDYKGNYSEKSTVTKTDLDRTTNSSEKNLIIKTDSEGNIDKSKTYERITDPKGLGNKHIVKVVDTEKTEDGQVTTTHTKTINGKNVEGNEDSYKTSNKVKMDSKGNYHERDITTKTDADGNYVSYEENSNISVDSSGDVSKSITTKQVDDPKGLMNKSTTTTSNTEKTKDGQVKTSKEITVDGKTLEKTTETSPQK
jgi:hypothetical protein